MALEGLVMRVRVNSGGLGVSRLARTNQCGRYGWGPFCIHDVIRLVAAPGPNCYVLLRKALSVMRELRWVALVGVCVRGGGGS